MKVKVYDVYEKGFVMPKGEQIDLCYADDSANIFYNGEKIHIGVDGIRVRIMKAERLGDRGFLAVGNYGARLFV